MPKAWPRRIGVFLLFLLMTVVVLLEELVWSWLHPLLDRLAALAPLARLEAWLKGLRPYPALLAAVAPFAVLEPLHLVAGKIILDGHAALGIAMLMGLKLVGGTLGAKIFVLCRPQILRLGWAAALYGKVVALHVLVMAEMRGTAAWRTAARLRVALHSRLAILRVWWAERRKGWSPWRRVVALREVMRRGLR